MTKKSWIVVAIICVLAMGGLIMVSRSNQLDVSDIDPFQFQAASELNGGIDDHYRGKKDSQVTMIVFGDFQCPGCASSAPIIKQLAQRYNEQINMIFRNFPLYSIHPNAFAAAAAAEAAGLQGKYWEMHDALYSEQTSWSSLTGSARTDYFLSLAERIGIDADTLRTNLENPSIKKKIDFDTALGKKAEVSATPSIYVDGELVSEKYFLDDKLVSKDTEGAQAIWTSADAFGKLIIEPALKKHGIALPETTEG